MKKFFVTLIILLILSGTGFFFGWAQRGVRPDSFGVIRSKTHGLDTRLVIPGEFRWLWYKLIPTNATTTVFRLNTVSRRVSARGVLPLSDVYTRFTGMSGEFSWELSASFSFSLAPDAIIPLVATYNIATQEELDRHVNEMAERLEAFILIRMNYSEAFALALEALLIDHESPVFTQEILRHFPHIRNFSFVIRSAQLPDFALYSMARDLYEEFIAMQREHITILTDEQAISRAQMFNRIEELGLIGELLSRYPILIDYLPLEGMHR